MTAHAQNSVVFSTAALQAQGTVGNSAYAGLSQWRVETRIHNLPATWNGYIYAFGVGNFELKLLYSTPTDRYLYLQDWTGATSGCNVDIGSRTDITLRAQRDGSATNETLRVWDSAGVELTNVVCFGTTRSGSDDLRGSAASGYLTIGGTLYSGVGVLQGDMAYFRLFSAAASPTAAQPADPAAPAADLLDYEFENNLTDSSGKGQALTSLPSGANLSYVSSGSSGSQTYSLQFQGAALQAQGTVGNSAYTGLSQWRVETRIHNLPPAWSGYIYAFGVGNFEIKLLYSTASDRYLYLEDWTGATSACNVDIGSRTDITLRAQSDGSAANETLRVWDSAGVELTNVVCFGTTRSGTDDLRGSATSGYLTIGGTTVSGVDVLQGDMAYFRLFSTAAPATVGEPTDASPRGDLLDYEFENNLTDSSGKGQVLTSLPSGASFSYVPSSGGPPPGPPSVGTFTSGSGSTQTFTFTASSAGGFSYLNQVQVIFGYQFVDGANGCYVIYNQASNSFSLINDAGSAAVAGSLPVSNSQCTLNSAQASGQVGTLTLQISLSFLPAFVGPLTVWEQAIDNANQYSSWTNVGTWTAYTASTTAPVVSVVTNPNGGTTGIFTFHVNDVNGYHYVNRYLMTIGAHDSAHSCEFLYYTGLNNIEILSDDGTRWQGSVALGVAGGGTLGNSQCTVDALHASVTTQGANDQYITLPVTFASAYLANGAEPIFATLIDRSQQWPWTQVGAWAPTAGGGTVPITIQTSVSGLSFIVDGVTYTTLQTRNWVPGDTTHTIGIAASPQSLTTGTQYVYSGWSDGLGQTHGITMPSVATTLTASFTTQFQLTINVTPTGAGTVSSTPTGPWYAPGTSVTLSAAPSGTYTFSGFNTTNPVIMNGPTTITATFLPPPSISSVNPGSGAAGTQVTVNGSNFGSTQGSGAVWLGTSPGVVTSWSNTQVVATVASSARSGTVVVQQGGFFSNALPFSVATLSITNVVPNSGVPGTAVTITGSGFGSTQGNSQVWLGTANGVVQTWSDTQVVAVVAAGAASGNAQILNNGVLSNAVPFPVMTPLISTISPSSAGPGSSVTITGSGFGAAQGSGTVTLGSLPGLVNSWTDTQIIAAVAANSLTGIVRIQQNGFVSKATRFTVSGSGNIAYLSPDLLNMTVGDTHPVQALDASGHSVTGLSWQSSNTAVVSLSADDPPILSALAVGHVTISAGNASADVTVSATAPLTGTVLWSSPGSGSGAAKIIPAVPSASGIADVFAVQNDGTVQAITSDGTVAWTANIGSDAARFGFLLADFQGGLVVESSGTPDTIYKLDGLTGQPYPAYTFSDPGTGPISMVVHTDGTIFANIETFFAPDGSSCNCSAAVIGIDPTTGSQKFSVPMPSSHLVNMIVAGDGYAYLPYVDDDGTGDGINYMKLMRISSGGTFTSFNIYQSPPREPYLAAGDPFPFTRLAYPGEDIVLISNGSDGVVMSWDAGYNGVDEPHLTTVSSAGVSDVSGPQMPAQQQAIAPILQRQDGSFVGLAYSGDPYSDFYHWTPYMVAFNASGNVLWSVPNEYPQIATADGGVIGQSGTTYDQNGNVTGQIANLPVFSWLGKAYRIGSVDQLFFDIAKIAATTWAFAEANASGNNTSVHLDWFPPLDHCTTTPGCIGPNEAIYNALSNLLARLADPTVSALAQSNVFSKLGVDAKGNPLTTRSFISYLTNKKPGFYNGLRSRYCYDSLTPPDLQGFCTWWGVSLLFRSVGDFFSGHAQTDAITATPRDMLQTFFRPSSILFNSIGQNIGNEGLIFHEALHGITGRFDSDIQGALGIPSSQPSCEITAYLQSTVLSHSDGLDPASGTCP